MADYPPTDEQRHEDDHDWNRGCMTCLVMTLLFIGLALVSIIFSRIK